MIDAELTHLLERYRRDRSGRAFEALAGRAIPVIESIARQRLRDPHGVEDARQEVLLRLARHADAIHGNVLGWLSATTRALCVDLVRREASQRRRLEAAAAVPNTFNDEAILFEALRHRLDEALALLDPQTRALVRRRFFQGLPLRELALEMQTSIATASRHVTRAMVDLREAYECIGVDGFTGDVLADAITSDAWRSYTGDATLRLHAYRPRGGVAAAAGRPGPAGWPRPIRVGVVVSHLSVAYPTFLGVYFPVEIQVQCVAMLADPRFELVGIIEPGTADYPLIERTVRTYDLTAGLIDGTDPEAMRTLDVIVIGRQSNMLGQVIGRVAEAVEEGVGCLNLGSLHAHGREYHVVPPTNRHLLGLRLAEAIVGWYCTTDVGDPKGRHHVAMPMRVTASHRALPGLGAGDRFVMPGCGVLLRPRADAQVLAVQEEPVRANCMCAECGAYDRTLLQPKHQILAGNYGRGRVFYSQSGQIEGLVSDPRLTGDFLESALTWLAEPRRP